MTDRSVFPFAVQCCHWYNHALILSWHFFVRCENVWLDANYLVGVGRVAHEGVAVLTLEVLQVSGATEWGRYLSRLIELSEIYNIVVRGLIEKYEILEAVPPQEICRLVGTSGLHCCTSGLRRSFEINHQFELFVHEVHSRHFVEGRILVYDVDDGHWPDEEQVVRAVVAADLDVVLMVRNELSLLRGALSDDLGKDRSTNDKGLSHVSDAEHEAQTPISKADAHVAGEHQGIGSLFGSRELGEDHAHHGRLQDDSGDALDAHHENGFRTFFRRVPKPITNRVLGLDGKQETAGECSDVVDAGFVSFVILVRYVVPVHFDDHEPDERKSQPTHDKSQEEDEERPSPLDVDQRRVEIL